MKAQFGFPRKCQEQLGLVLTILVVYKFLVPCILSYGSHSRMGPNYELCVA